MKRVYKSVDVDERDEGFAVTLDGHGARTPGREGLVLPNRDLAMAIAAEWEAQREEIDPAVMPLTRLANTAIDRVREHRNDVIGEIAKYGETDLIYFRAGAPDKLIRRQMAAWDPYVNWAAVRFGVMPATAQGALFIEQPPALKPAVREVVAAHNEFELAALHALTTTLGSVVLALVLAGRDGEVTEIWLASRVDHIFQEEQWGSDAAAGEKAEAERALVLAAARFLELARR